jgi:hypothetical protein
MADQAEASEPTHIVGTSSEGQLRRATTTKKKNRVGHFLILIETDIAEVLSLPHAVKFAAGSG